MGWNILISVNGLILHKEKITILGGNKMSYFDLFAGVSINGIKPQCNLLSASLR